ncbi:MAG: M28 family peptidase [Spirochaetia bacterium]
MRLVEEQVSLGPRVPGTTAHDNLLDLLESRLRRHATETMRQEFRVTFRGQSVACANLVGAFRAAHPAGGPILLGTHFDTRPRADLDADPARRESPIPGANDGGSGTAVLQHMLEWLSVQKLSRDVLVAFFDAEDLGSIDGNDFSLGAEWCACHPPWGTEVAEVVVLDMVGGRGMVFDIDAHIFLFPAEKRLTLEVFRLGSSRGWPPFTASKPQRLKYVISDHHPFALRGIPSCLLIDLDYPEWHTHADTPQAMSAASLGITEAALSLYLSRFQA